MTVTFFLLLSENWLMNVSCALISLLSPQHPPMALESSQVVSCPHTHYHTHTPKWHNLPYVCSLGEGFEGRVVPDEGVAGQPASLKNPLACVEGSIELS